MKKKKLLKTIVILLVLLSVCFFSYQIVHKAAIKKETSEKIKSLPDFKFFTLDEKNFTNADVPANMPALIVYFSPDCDHCQSEAQDLREHMSWFKNIEVLMVTDKSRQEVAAFAEQYKLKEFSQVIFLLDKEGSFFKTFGKTGFPECFIYNGDHKLVKVYDGETKAEAIQKAFEL